MGIWSYGAFGETIWNNTNSVDGASYGYKGQYSKMGESWMTLAPVQMGARAYIPSLGRFLQVDPVEGGVDNNYVYPTDPVNNQDISGQCPMCLYLLYLALPAIYEGLNALSDTPTGGSVGRAANLSEHLAMQEVRAAPQIGSRIMQGMIKDSRYLESQGWQKMRYIHRSLTRQEKIVVHYFYHPARRVVRQVKIKRGGR